MAKAATLEVEIGAKIDQFERSLGKVRKDLGGMEKKLGGVSRATNKASTAFSGMAKRLVAVGLAYFGARGIFRMAKSFLDVATSVETYKLRLDAMLGSQQAATEAMAFFKDVAAKVPFTLEQVIEAGVKVQAFGADLKAWTPIMADLAAFMGVTLPEAASALGRAFAGGAGAADIFRERGILQVIKDFARMERGIDDITKISLPEFRDVMFDAFAGAESKVAGTADKLATTWVGTVSMLQDKWFKFRDAVMKAGVFKILKEELASFNEKLDKFVESGGLEEWAKNTAIAIMGLFKTVAKGIEVLLLVVHEFQAAVFESSALVLDYIRDFIKKLIAGYVLLGEVMPAYKQVAADLIKVWSDLGIISGEYWDKADEHRETMADAIEQFEKFAEKIRTVREKIEETKSATEDLNTKTKELGETIAENVAPAMSILAGYLNIIIPLTTKLATTTTDVKKSMKSFTESQIVMMDALMSAYYGGIKGLIDYLERLALAEMLKWVFSTYLFPASLAIAAAGTAAVKGLFAVIKSFKEGGFVPQETLAHLHPGEYVLPAKDVQSVMAESREGKPRVNMTIHAPITINARTLDDRTIAEAEEKLTRAVQRGIARAKGY